MTKEEMAQELYPVRYQGDVKRMPPDKNLPLRQAFLLGWESALRWRPMIELPASPGPVLVACVDDDGHCATMMARYTGEYFDLLGVMFWTPIAWLPIPEFPKGLKKQFFEI